MKYPTRQNGFQTKTVYIRSVAGALRFNLQQVNELGLPQNALILGIQARVHNNTIIGANNLPLVDASVFDNAFISLKDRSSASGKIDLLLSEYPLSFLQRFGTEFIQPVESCLIDWNQSYIQINPRVTANDNEVFELLIYYSDMKSDKPFPNRFLFRNGEEFSGERIASFDVPLNTVQNQYALSNTNNIGLPQDAIILGFSTHYKFNPLYGERQSSQSYDSTYITLKQGTCAFIDQYPVNQTDYDGIVGTTNYLPIVPTNVMAIDWQQSKIEIKDLTGLANDQAFNFSIYWWIDENC